MHQQPENASDRNYPKTYRGKGVKWDPHFQKIEGASDTAETESLMMPRSGIRRNSVHLNAFNESHNAVHAEVAKTRVRNRWHIVKGFLGKQRTRESSSMGNNKCNNWDCNDDSYSKSEKTDEPICLEECFCRDTAVAAIPEEASSDCAITFVSRSFEVNPTARHHWSTLKDAISSGKIFEEEEDEKSGLRRMSLAPARRMEAKIPSVSQGSRSGWFKLRKLRGRKASSQSSKYDVAYSGNNSVSSNEIDDCVYKDTPELLQRNRDEEFYAVIDSSVQALPSDVVSNTEVVSVTRSFEYHGNWQKIRNMLKKQDGSQEQKMLTSDEESHSSPSEVKIDCLENALLKKDVYCQTEFNLEKALQHQILKNLFCAVCGSKYEERDPTTTEDKIDWNETRVSDDEGRDNSFLKQDEKNSVCEKKIKSDKDTCKECETTSCGTKLVADILESEQLTTAFQEDGSREVNEALMKHRHERKGDLPDSRKIDLGFCEGGSSVDFDDDSISFDKETIKHEREEYGTSKGSIAGKFDDIVSRAFDDGGFGNKKCIDHQIDTKFPQCKSIGTVMEDREIIVPDHKVEEAPDVILGSQNQEEMSVVSLAELPVSTFTVGTEHASKEGQSPRIPVMVTAKVFECDKPFVISYV